MITDGLISVIVPVYKVEKYLHKCVDSIINQTYKNLEIILVDDGSPDNCPAICDEYSKQDKRVKVIHKANGGTPAGARNVGLDNANGEFIAFVDSDDWIEPTMYEKLICKQKENNADLVFCRMNWITDGKIKHYYEKELYNFCKTKNVKYLITEMVVTDKTNVCFAKCSVFGCIWRTLFKKASIGNIRFDSKCFMGEDLLFLYNVLSHKLNKIEFINDYLYNYLIREGSACRPTDGVYIRVNKTINDSKVFIANWDSILEDIALKKEIVGRYKFNSYANCYLNLLGTNNYNLLETIKEWGSKENYKYCKKYTKKLKTKIINWLICHKMKNILRFLKKIKG